MLKLTYHPHTSVFKEPSGTSRGVLLSKESWIVNIWDDANPECTGVGEISLIPGLSIEHPEEVMQALLQLEKTIDQPDILDTVIHLPAVRFGIETALIDLENGGKQQLFPTDFTHGKKPIPINGLIWMGSYDEMRRRITEKIELGYTCIKIKIGAIDFEKELELIRMIRSEFGPRDIEIRLDANGAFSAAGALSKLEKLAVHSIHSVEQPIKPNQWTDMAHICASHIIPIALDEELIGIHHRRERKNMLNEIKPQYIVLKPSLLGGFESCDEWIELAQASGIGWWATSALETNIGLNAIAQWVSTKEIHMPQGLGTGQLFTNNFLSNLEIKRGELWTTSHSLAG
ncbi:MAG TPA: o-succinylbenzoate synthase [Luteibaculaceae bacterium]|nr:o-succinylbenzoate synthase [Luteibaculaceae bacterium]